MLAPDAHIPEILEILIFIERLPRRFQHLSFLKGCCAVLWLWSVGRCVTISVPFHKLTGKHCVPHKTQATKPRMAHVMDTHAMHVRHGAIAQICQRPKPPSPKLRTRKAANIQSRHRPKLPSLQHRRKTPSPKACVTQTADAQSFHRSRRQSCHRNSRCRPRQHCPSRERMKLISLHRMTPP